MIRIEIENKRNTTDEDDKAICENIMSEVRNVVGNSAWLVACNRCDKSKMGATYLLRVELREETAELNDTAKRNILVALNSSATTLGLCDDHAITA